MTTLLFLFTKVKWLYVHVFTWKIYEESRRKNILMKNGKKMKIFSLMNSLSNRKKKSFSFEKKLSIFGYSKGLIEHCRNASRLQKKPILARKLEVEVAFGWAKKKLRFQCFYHEIAFSKQLYSAFIFPLRRIFCLLCRSVSTRWKKAKASKVDLLPVTLTN